MKSQRSPLQPPPHFRHEIDADQELKYTATIQALLKIRFDGFVAKNPIPVRSSKITSLRQGVEICHV